MTRNSRHKHHSKKPGPSQEKLVNAVWAEFEEDILLLGPRLFDDEYYDDSIELNLPHMLKKNRGKNVHNKGHQKKR